MQRGGRNRIMRIQPGIQLSLQTPNVPRQFSQTHHDLVAGNVDLEKACADVVHCEPGVVKWYSGNGTPINLLRSCTRCAQRQNWPSRRK